MFGWLVILLLTLPPQTRGIGKAGCFTALSKLPAPAGYRYPVESDVSDYWQFYRDEHGRQASCKSADLNGDGVADVASLALRTVGQGFAVVVLYSGQKQYEPRVVWEDAWQVYRAGDARLEIARQGRHAKYLGCTDDSATFTLPSAGVDYFNRLPYSIERPGTRTKPEHRLFWSSNRGVTPSGRDLCSAEDWAREQQIAR
jgi:hypothetical protein